MKVRVLIVFCGCVCFASTQELLPSNTKPTFSDYNPKQPRNEFAQWLLFTSGNYTETHAEFPPYDGWYNNLATPDSGAIDRPLLRRWPAAYEDGTYLPAGKNRPNPIELSEELLQGPIGSQSRTGKNAMLVFFGQQIVEEILDAQRPACPPEYFNIEIPENHKYRNSTGHTEMPVLRTRFDQRTGINPNNPRQQLNEITPYIDGGLVYGTTKQWADQLRTYSNGTIDPDGLLAYSENGLFPERNTHRLPMANPPPPFYHSQFIKNHETLNVDRFFKLGNPRGNENTFLLTFGILWFRWHNYLAREIRAANPQWASEQVFNEARKWVIATQQHIILDEWLPSWISRNLTYGGYDPSINPQIDQFFQSAAFRFGHTLVTPGVYMRDYGRNGCRYNFLDILGTNAVRTCNAFWRPQETILSIYENTTNTTREYMDIDRMLMGMAYQICEEEDHKIVEDLRGNVFGPLEFPRRDLMALNIQRGRDHGLPDFNSARKAFGLRPALDFHHFYRVDLEIRTKLASLYNNDINNIDVWVGGILETGDGPGELFETIIIDQFRRIMDGDRFWYENTNNNLFTRSEIARIKALRLYDIIMAVTKMDPMDIQPDVTRIPLIDTVIHQNCRIAMKPPDTCQLIGGAQFPCYHLPILNEARLNESCKDGSTYDYFMNSELSFILTFTAVGVSIFGLIAFVFIYMSSVKSAFSNTRAIEFTRVEINGSIITAKEWYRKGNIRSVVLQFKTDSKAMQVLTTNGYLLRTIVCGAEIEFKNIVDQPYLVISPKNSYDLVLLFESNELRQSAIRDISNWTNQYFKHTDDLMYKDLDKKIITKEDREKHLEYFFKIVVSQAYRIPQNPTKKLSNKITHILKMELTLDDFAELLNMSNKNQFVDLMFRNVDKDNNNIISFRELVELITLFIDGTAVDKIKFLFSMFDTENQGVLSRDDFKKMFKSFLEIVQGNIDDEVLDDMINRLVPSNNAVTLNDFINMVGGHIDELDNVRFQFRYPVPTGNQNNRYAPQERQRKCLALIRVFEKNSKDLFWMTLYTLVMLGIFIERAYYYTIEREHSGLRTIAGYGVTVTRGAASVMMFTYSSLLVTMCKNINTKLRDTSANKYFPFDSYVKFHKYIAYWALFFTVMHVIGHAFNFYHISTQPADDLTCLFRNYFHSTHEFPKFHYWCWQTITGVTGIVLTVLLVTIFIFALPIVRTKLYNSFWLVHSMYPIFFIFMILHGSGRLIQEPYFHYFFLGPVTLFAVDQLISVSRSKMELQVLKAEILPSGVTLLKIQRPYNFEYKSGQWVRIACKGLSATEFHPFTLSSSPNESNLTVHIRAVGPWTNNIRNIYTDAIQKSGPYPEIYLDGPFGEGHQDWDKFNVSILIGGGIGVTPFASILKDIVFKANLDQLRSKKVYFFWISRDQKQFEWLMDTLKDIEKQDRNNIISSFIYITGYFEHLDLRAIMLYIFERNYQNISKMSLFTGLRAQTRFGKPNFEEIFTEIVDIHSMEQKIGVYSCGAPKMLSQIDASCMASNRHRHNPVLDHYYKIF